MCVCIYIYKRSQVSWSRRSYYPELYVKYRNVTPVVVLGRLMYLGVKCCHVRLFKDNSLKNVYNIEYKYGIILIVQ